MTTNIISQTKTRTPKMGLHKPTGQAYVRLNGQMLYLGPWGRPETTQRYHREIAEWIARGRRPEVAPEEITVVELCAEYTRYAEGYYVRPDGTNTSELDRVKMALRIVKEMYGAIPAAEFGPNALRSVRQMWIENHLARKSINACVGTVKRMFKWAVSHEMLPGTVYHALSTLDGLRRGRSEARETEAIKPVSDDHVTKAREHVSRQVAALIELQQLTAARSGELLKLRPCDFDTNGKVWTARVNDHKMSYRGQDRILYFGPKAQAIVRPFLLRDPEAYLFSPKEAEAERYAKCEKHRHQPTEPAKTDRTLRDHYTTDTYRKAIEYGCKAAKIPVWTPHRLRHNAATEIRRQFGIEAAQLILGHTRCDVTQVYAEVNHVKALEIAAQIG